ncbi:tannase/feruloyl esterase family alpha/beta hydrolase [Nocardioides albertanoniae]|nr:tannase/feruloyl esterase family alpha/beta hydrolase [Nocardioides albertanoniae]
MAQVTTRRDAEGNAGAGRTRPLCEWPSWPAYVGGEVSEAKSFRCRD